MKPTTRIGFLFNHVAEHQVYHGAPVAFQLSRMAKNVEVAIISASPLIEETAQEIGRLYPEHKVTFVNARVPRLIRFAASLMRPVRLTEKDMVRRFNRGLYRDFDVLVVPEANSLKLRNFPELTDLKLVYTHHGAGDRSVGYHPRHREFDLILCPGTKIRDRLKSDLEIPDQRLVVTGYPKLEVIDRMAGQRRIFNDQRPVVLYNPHFSNDESSWRQYGMQVLEYFAAQDDFNLIFAPHLLLYARGLRHGARSLRRFRGHPRIHIDTGSAASSDMTYTNAADIYLGDVSSQVYEFVRTPRPCIFLDACGDENPANRLHQRMGEVIESIEELPEALDRAFDSHRHHYDSKQRELLRITFDESSTQPSERGARAILDWLNGSAFEGKQA